MRTARAFTVCRSLLPGAGGVPGPGGCTWSWGGVPGPGDTWSGTPPMDRMTHAYENITLPKTSSAGGKHKHLLFAFICGKKKKIANVQLRRKSLAAFYLQEFVLIIAQQTKSGMCSFCWNFTERQILWSLCSVDFHALILQLPIQTLHSVAPERQVFVSSLENCPNFSKTSTPLVLYDKHILSDLRYKMQFFGIITI